MAFSLISKVLAGSCSVSLFFSSLSFTSSSSNRSFTIYSDISGLISLAFFSLHQIQHVNNKLAKNVGIINKLRNYLDFHMLKQLYYTLIYPYLNYGLASWGTAYKTRLNKICTKQNRCIRSMFFAHGREHVDSYYNLLGILKFENIYRLKVSLFIYKFKNDKSNTPAVLLNILIPASDIHSYNTRYAANQNFFKPSVRTNWYIYI